MHLPLRTLFVLLISFGSVARGQSATDLQSLTFDVNGVKRTALLYVPPGKLTAKVPLVFVFHGHGGTSLNAEQSFHTDRFWPEAISIYPQGLDTPGQLTDPTGQKTGWQAALGDEGNRDINFFDAMLARLKAEYPIDPKRIYCTGHSNGGGFTYLLWLARPAVFAAVAPSSAVASYSPQLTPKPVLSCAGKSDPLVLFSWQEAELAELKKVDHCAAAGTSWEGGAGTLYPSALGMPVVTHFYDGGHTMDPAQAPLIVTFFQQHPAK